MACRGQGGPAALLRVSIHRTSRPALERNAAPGAGFRPHPRRSLLRSAPALVLFAIAIADVMRSADTDLWAHIYFGRVILTHHQFLFHAPFSYACPPGPSNWIVHDWLGNVLMALVYGASGVLGLKLAKLACVAAVMVLLSVGQAETRAPLEVQAIVLSMAAIALVPLMEFRTFLADDICLAALMAMLARESYDCDGRLWLAVPMFALWANLHGGFFVGLAALGLYTAVRCAQDLAESRRTRRAVRLAALTSASALATLINPYGSRAWTVIVGVVRNPFTLVYVPEFHSMFARIADLYRQQVPVFTFVFALAIMAALFSTFALTPRADDLALFAVAALITASALYAERNTALAVIACCIPLCRHARLLVDRLHRNHSVDMPAHPLLTRAPLQVPLALVAAGLAIHTGLLSNRLPASRVKPVGALAFMRQHGLHGNTLSAFAWADYLIWHDDAPDSKIFIESLFEAYYPEAVQDDYLAFEEGSSRAAEVLNVYPHDFILFPTQSPPSRFMETRGAWKLIYRDPVSSIFARADSPAGRVPGVPVLSETAPPSFFP
jgi:hypothetical protein